MKTLFLSICLALALFVPAAFSCTLAGKTLAKFDETEYVFIGEVVGYTKGVKSPKLDSEAFGLIVKLKESVYLPKQPKTHFEIFPIQLWADCSISGTDIKDLKNKFPLNSEVRVIAKGAEILPDLSDGNVRLEDRPDAPGSVVLNNDKTARASVNSFFDYKAYKYDINEDSTSKYLLPEFEARKDLLRLKNSQDQAAKNKILARLLYFPIGYSVDVYEVFKEYSENKTAYEHFYCKRLLEIEGLSDDEFTFLKPKLPAVCSQYKNKG